MIIAYAATRNIYHKLVPSLRSLMEFNNPERIYILSEDDTLPFDIPHTSINVSGQTYFNGMNTQTPFTWMSLMRLVLADLIEEDRILYLDVDTIINDSLLPVWETDMDGKWWAAVEELFGKWKPFGRYYYNAGVSLYNLKQMRKDHAIDQITELLNRFYFPYPDQDVMNKLCVPDKVVPLDVRYNESFCCGHTKNPAVIHYAGYTNWYESKVPRSNYLDKYR